MVFSYFCPGGYVSSYTMIGLFRTSYMASENDRMMNSGTLFNALSNGIIKLGENKFYLIFELREPYKMTVCGSALHIMLSLMSASEL